MAAHATQKPEPISRRRHETPNELATIVMRCSGEAAGGLAGKCDGNRANAVRYAARGHARGDARSAARSARAILQLPWAIAGVATSIAAALAGEARAALARASIADSHTGNRRCRSVVILKPMFNNFLPEALFSKKLQPATERRMRLACAGTRRGSHFIRAHVESALTFVDALWPRSCRSIVRSTPTSAPWECRSRWRAPSSRACSWSWDRTCSRRSA